MEDNKSKKKNLRKKSISKIIFIEIGTLLFKIISIIFVFLLIFSFIYGVHRVNDQSMKPSFVNGDIVVYYRIDKKLISSDNVIVEQGGEIRVRRVVATAGDEVDIDQNGLKINGYYIQEEGIYEKTNRYEKGIEFPLIVPQNEVFVLGDKREHSADSRIYGCVKISDVYGKVIMVIRNNP